MARDLPADLERVPLVLAAPDRIDPEVVLMATS